MPTIIVFVSAIALLWSLAAEPDYVRAQKQAAKTDKGKEPEKVPAVEHGRKLYDAYCTFCHGVKRDGEGDFTEYLSGKDGAGKKPANHLDKKRMGERTAKQIFDTIKGGGPETNLSVNMPQWGKTFDDDQIRDLVAYLRSIAEPAQTIPDKKNEEKE